MVQFLQKYAKGHVAVAGTVAIAALDYGNQFCGSIWPVVAGGITSVLVILVPNYRR